ncbi:MAG: phage holin family protein [Pseudomonadales bacterium]|mgnify:CR=1 FL=1|nr:phage holin family protein [Pseudomonadales bacterium]
MIGFVLRGLIAALGLWIATRWLPGVAIDTPLTLVLAGLLLGLVNAIVRPIAIILTLPMTIVTLGLFLLVINAAMVGLVALMMPGFQLRGFWNAVLTAIIVSLVSWIGSWFIGSRGKIEVLRRDAK